MDTTSGITAYVSFLHNFGAKSEADHVKWREDVSNSTVLVSLIEMRLRTHLTFSTVLTFCLSTLQTCISLVRAYLARRNGSLTDGTQSSECTHCCTTSWHDITACIVRFTSCAMSDGLSFKT